MASQPASSGSGVKTLQKAIELGRVGLAKTAAGMRALEPPSKQDFDQARPSSYWTDVQYYVFSGDPASEGLQGYLMSTLETVAVMHASSLEHLKTDDSGLTLKAGYPWIRESPDDADSDDTIVRKVMLDVDDPNKVPSAMMNYIRARVKGDFGAEDSDTAICNWYFNLDKMATTLTAPSEGFTMWSFAMFDALRLLALSAEGVGAERRWPVGLSKAEFLGTVAEYEKRCLERFDKTESAIVKAPAANITPAGVSQALTVAGNIAESLRAKYANAKPVDQDGPASKKQRAPPIHRSNCYKPWGNYLSWTSKAGIRVDLDLTLQFTKDARFQDLHNVWDHLASTSRAATTENTRRSAMRLFAWFCFSHSLLIATPNSTYTHSLPRSDPCILAYYLCYLYKAAYMLGTIK